MFCVILRQNSSQIVLSEAELKLVLKRTCEVNRMGENSYFYMLRRNVPDYDFKLVWAVLHLSLNELFKTIYPNNDVLFT